MDAKLLLVKCITLLYREAHQDADNASTKLCQSVTETIKIPEASSEVQSGRESIIGLRDTLFWMMEHVKEGFERAQLLQRIRINTGDDAYLYNAVVDGIEITEDNDQNKSQILSYRRDLYQHIKDREVDQIITQAWNDVRGQSDNTKDYREIVRRVFDQLEPYTHDIANVKHHSIVDSVNFENEEELQELMGRATNEISSEGGFKTGWQAVNRMMGRSGVMRRGETWVIGALQHNYKSGFTRDLFRHFAMYNKPFMKDESKKPLLIHISLEDDLTINILRLYRNIKENLTLEPVDISTEHMSKEEKLEFERAAAAYIKEQMGVNGFHIEMMRINPSEFTIHDFKDMVTRFETEGYEIHAIVVDYLSMANKSGLDRSGPTGSDIRELFRRARNITSARNILFITPHQLSTEAKMLVRQGVEDFVKEIESKGYYDGCRTIDQEVDGEIYIHIVDQPGEGSFLTVQRGKHRGVNQTPKKDRYCVLPFYDVGDLREDINGADNSRESIGGATVENGGGEWFNAEPSANAGIM